MELIEEINSYIHAIKNIQDSINQLQGDKFLKNHKKTLLLSLLETISKGVYGRKYVYKNYKRFKNFILEFCEWEDANKISLQQLSLLLEREQNPKFQRLKRYVDIEIRKYPSDSPVPFSYDITIEKIKSLMPIGETEIYGVKIDKLTHVSLLWEFRNNLVHEARSIGSQEVFDVNYPHYVQYTIAENGREIYEICYPVDFFNNLVERAIGNVRDALINSEQNPWMNYNFSELWIKHSERI